MSCQTTGSPHPTMERPWVDTPRATDKDDLAKYVGYHPEGLPLSKIVRDVFRQDTATADADYQLARRFYTRHAELFEITTRGATTWVEPTPRMMQRINLIQQYANRKTTSKQPDAFDTGEKLAENHPKDRASAALRSMMMVAESARQPLLDELRTEKSNLQDRYQVFERVRGSGKSHLLLPYETRHTSAARAAKIRTGFNTALSKAAESHDDAVMMTVTTDPKRHDSLSEAVDALRNNKSRLLSFLSTEYRLGYRPQNLTTLEFSDNGLPHLHIVLFGVSWAVSQETLSSKWSEYGQGEIVDIRRVRSRRGRWRFGDDADATSLRSYLGKAIDECLELAKSDPEEIDESAWKQALYWALEAQYYSCSPSLKPDSKGTELPQVTVWRYVGAASYDQVPGHVRRQSNVDPSGGSDTTEGDRDG